MKFNLLLVFTFITTLVFSQNLTQTIRGTVTDKQTLQPIIGAKVIVVGSEPLIGSVTNLDGQFRLEKYSIKEHNV